MTNFLSKSKKDYLYILILLIPILSIFSIFLLEVALIIILFNFLFFSVKEKNYYYFNNFFFKFFLVFYLYLLINFYIQVDQIKSLSVIFYFRYALYTLAIYFFLDNRPNLCIDFIKVVFVCVIILGIDTVFQTIFGYNILGFEIIEKNRPSSFFGDELILGSYIFRLLPFIFIFLIINDLHFHNYYKYLLVFISFLTVLLSGERTSIILSIFLLFLYFFLLRKNKMIKILKYASVIFLIALTTILFFSKKYQQRYIFEPINDLTYDYSTTQDLLRGYDHKPKIIFFSGLHHNLMVTSLRIFNDNKIFGSGPRSYRTVCEKYKINRYSCDTHSHNYYLQILSETGLIGFLFLVFLYLVTFKKIFNLSKNLNDSNHELKICFLTFYLAALWPVIPSGNFFNNWLSIMTYLPISFYLFIEKKNSKI